MSNNRPIQSVLLLAVISIVTVTLMAGSQSSDSSWKQNEERLNSYTAAEIEALKRKKETFDQWPEKRQQHLIKLHEQIMQHPQKEELLAVMDRYIDWVKRLSVDERTEINQYEPEQRVDAVREIRNQQARQLFGVVHNSFLPQKDFSTLFDWIGKLLDSKRGEMIETLRRKFNQNISRPNRSQSSRRDWDEINNEPLFRAYMRFAPEQAREMITTEDVASLHAQLSPQGQQTLDNLPDDQQRRTLVNDWVRAAVYSLRDPKMFNQLDAEFDEALDRFYREEMTQEQRDRVDKLYAKTRQREITKLYFWSRVNSPSSGPDRQERD